MSKPVKYKSVVFVSHVRGPGGRLLEAVNADEFTDISRQGPDVVVRLADCPVLIVVPWSNVKYAWVEDAS